MDILKDDTRNKILKVSEELFIEKGYENTTIQDIVDNLDGLTKGSIYYYFSSKSDIFNNVLVNFSMEPLKKLADGDSAIGVLRNTMLKKLEINLDTRYKLSKMVLRSSEMIGEYYLNLYELKNIFMEHIKNNKKDTSEYVKYFEEFVEIAIVYFNLSLMMHITELSIEQYLRKVKFIKTIYDKMNFPLFDKVLIKKIESAYVNLENK